MKLSELGEQRLIERIVSLASRRQVPDPAIVVGVGDDAAAIDTGRGPYLLLTTDVLVADIHFMPGTDPRFIGYKAVAASVSDIAAMAGTPRYLLITIGAPAETDVSYIDGLYDGILEAAQGFGIELVGGDTTASAVFFVSAALTGDVPPELLKRRSDAAPGDLILVTGSLGGSAAGLEFLKRPDIELPDEVSSRVVGRHVSPLPRLKEARIAAASGAHAMEDVSDGLATELNHIAQASNAGVVIDAARIPIDNATSQAAAALGADALSLALFGGEDYELVLTAPPETASHLMELVTSETGTQLTSIGHVTSDRGRLTLIGRDGSVTQIARRGYEHFKGTVA